MAKEEEATRAFNSWELVMMLRERRRMMGEEMQTRYMVDLRHHRPWSVQFAMYMAAKTFVWGFGWGTAVFQMGGGREKRENIKTASDIAPKTTYKACSGVECIELQHGPVEIGVCWSTARIGWREKKGDQWKHPPVLLHGLDFDAFVSRKPRVCLFTEFRLFLCLIIEKQL